MCLAQMWGRHPCLPHAKQTRKAHFPGFNGTSVGGPKARFKVYRMRGPGKVMSGTNRNRGDFGNGCNQQRFNIPILLHNTMKPLIPTLICGLVVALVALPRLVEAQAPPAKDVSKALRELF